jgi:hypothetical protein
MADSFEEKIDVKNDKDGNPEVLKRRERIKVTKEEIEKLKNPSFKVSDKRSPSEDNENNFTEIEVLRKEQDIRLLEEELREIENSPEDRGYKVNDKRKLPQSESEKEEKKNGFNPEEELKKIRSGTKAEQKQKLADFKRRLVEQKKGIAEIQKKIFEEVMKKPDASAEEYLKSIQDTMDRFYLSNDQQDAFKKALEAYSKTHQAIRENTKDYVNEKTGETDGAKIFEKLFKQKPIGRIEVILQPASIYFRIENLDDYVVARKHGEINEITDKDREDANETGGLKLGGFNVAGLEHAITLEKATDGEFDKPFNEVILIHETQHVLNEIIRKGYDAEQKKVEKRRERHKKEVSDTSTELKDDIHKKHLAGYENIRIEKRIKDEISAYFLAGRSPENIREVLLNPDTIYKYGFNYKGGNEEKKEFSQEYIDLVEGGIAAFSTLLKSRYSVEDVQALLFVEPLSKWTKVVERISQEDKRPNERIEQLKKDLEEARKKYAEEEYKVNNNISKIKAFFSNIKTKPADISEVNEAYTDYKNKASELSRAQIDEIKNRNLDPEAMKKEMGDLIKYFNYGEKMNLYAARTNARAEINKDNVAFKVLEKSGQFINWYRKVDWKKKAVFSLGLGFITGGSLSIGQRALGSAAAGVGAAIGMEAYQRKKAADKSEEKKENILKDFENSQEKMDEVMKQLEAEIDGYEKSLKNELSQARTRKFVGLGTAAGTFFAGKIVGEWLSGNTAPLVDYAKSFLGVNSPGSVGGENNFSSENYIKKYNMAGLAEDSNVAAVSGDPQAAAEAGKAATKSVAEKVLEVEEGSSLEGSLIKHLESTGLNHADAGKTAHRMALEYAKNKGLENGPYSLIHEGAKLKIGSDGKLIEILGDDNLGYLSEKEILAADKTAPIKVGEMAASASVEDFRMDGEAGESITNINKNIKSIESRIFFINKEMPYYDRGVVDADQVERLVQERKILESQAIALNNEKCANYFKAFLKYLKWEDVGNLSNLQFEQTNDAQRIKFNNLYDSLIKSNPDLRESLKKPGNNEQVKDWLVKVTRALAGKK